VEQQNEHLEEQNTRQRNFVSVISHEFRTALTSIQGFSEIMQTSDFSRQETREYMGDICSEAQRLNRLVSDLLDLERMKVGNTKLHMEHVDINTLIEKVVNRMHAVSEHHTLRLDLERFEQGLTGDPDKLIQVMTNLISNATKYSPEGGEVVLRSRREGENISISVQDCGIGIPQEKLEEVFQQYTRVESDSTRSIGGTGLGLPIVRQIVEMHGGRVWAESSLGKGSTFHVQFPLASKSLL
jgi:signal transduction histidine kinase